MQIAPSDLERRWLPKADLGAVVLLVAAGILFFSDPLFSSKNFYYRDILNFHYPLRRVLIDSYARGEFPLWNPFIYLGQPMLANPNYMAFYPSNIFHAFLPFNYAFKLHFLIHPILAGVGIYFLQRRLGIQRLAALGGSIAYQFSGTLLSFLNLYNIVPAIALIPWIGWAFLGALRGNWWRRSLLFGFLLGLQVIAFEPLMFQCNLFLLAGLGLYHFFESEDRRQAAFAVGRAGLVGCLLALALAAVQVLPTLELMPLTTRGAGYNFAIQSLASMHWADLGNVVIPDLFGTPFTVNRSTYWGEFAHDEKESYLVSFFLGTGVVVLSFLALFSPRRKLRITLTSLTVISLALALGKFNLIYFWLWDNIPLFRLGRYPSKYFLLGALTLAILTALGLEVILNPKEVNSRARRLIILWTVLCMVLAGVLAGAWLYWKLTPHLLEDWIRSSVRAGMVKDYPTITSQLLLSIRSSAFFLFLTAALVFVSQFWRRSALVGGLLVFLLGAELIPANLRLSPLIAEDVINFVPEVSGFLGQLKDVYRVVPPTTVEPLRDLRLRIPNLSAAWLTLFYRKSGQPMYGIMDGIQYSLDPSVDNLNTREPDELIASQALISRAEFFTLLQKLNSPVLLTMGEIQDPRVRLLKSFETQTDMNINVYWLENTLSRSYFVSGVEIASTQKNALERLIRPDFRFGNTVILEDSRIAKERVGETGAGVARIADYRSTRVLCEVEARIPGYLVLLDSYYPGWRAYLDGNEVGILRANHAFRAVEVPAGKHQVEFIYRPRVFYAGLTITCLALISGLVIAIWRPRRFL